MWNFEYLCVSYFPTLLNWAEWTNSEKTKKSWNDILKVLRLYNLHKFSSPLQSKALQRIRLDPKYWSLWLQCRQKFGITWKFWKFFKLKEDKALPEVNLAVHNDKEEKRENAVNDQVGVGQVNLDTLHQKLSFGTYVILSFGTYEIPFLAHLE